jgi:hypothetical protein
MKKSKVSRLLKGLIITPLLTCLIFISCQEEEFRENEAVNQLVQDFNLQKLSAQQQSPNTLTITKFSNIEEAKDFLLKVKSLVPSQTSTNLKKYKPSTAKSASEGEPQPCTAAMINGTYLFTYSGMFSNFNVNFTPSTGTVSSYLTGFIMGVGYEQTNSSYGVQPNGDLIIYTWGVVQAGVELNGVVYGYTQTTLVQTTYTSSGVCIMENQNP